MKEQNNIEELFRDKLQNIEANPGTNAWANVQAGISSSPVVASSAASWGSTAIVAVTITAIAVGGYYFFNKEGEKKTQHIEKSIIESVQTEQQDQESTPETNPSTELKTEELIAAPEEKVEVNSIQQEQSNKIKIVSSEKEATQEVDEKMIDEIIAKHQASSSISENVVADENTTSPQKEIIPEEAVDNSLKESTNQKETESPTQSLTDKDGAKLITDQVIFPNVFTPDGDGHNDLFRLDMENSIEIDNIKVSIFDKTGKLVNEWSGLYNGWNGTYKDGTIAKKDSYIYKAVILKDNKEYVKANSFTLY